MAVSVNISPQDSAAGGGLNPNSFDRDPAPGHISAMEWEATARLSVFLGGFVLLALAEAARPKRPRALGRTTRWASNLALVAIDTALVRILFPLAAVGAALDASAQGWGLFNWLGWPLWLTVILSFVILDFAIWLQHVIFHKVPLLWRFHMVHHADRDMDVTTGLRFHPVEIAASMLIKIALVYALGAPALGMIVFEIILNASAMWSHSNLRLPEWVERPIRWVVVTPDMHRVHHSTRRRETNSNFGFNLPWWDYLLGTYRAQPKEGHHAMSIGLPELRNEQEVERLAAILALPFRRSPSGEAKRNRDD